MGKIDILGVKFFNTTLNNLVKLLANHISNNKKAFIVTANPEIVMYAKKNNLYKRILDEADYITADGIGIVKASEMLKQPLPERVAGYDLMLELLTLAEKKKLKIYFLGAKEEVLFQTVQNTQTKYPNANIVGFHHGYFDWNDNTIVKTIQELEPDLIFVGLGFPKQEEWIYQNFPEFNKGLFIGIGGSLDVLAGSVKRAPDFWIKLNLEWFYRLIKQPSRLKRMMVLPKFAITVMLNKK